VSDDVVFPRFAMSTPYYFEATACLYKTFAADAAVTFDKRVQILDEVVRDDVKIVYFVPADPNGE